jgi:hypothetical protein
MNCSACLVHLQVPVRRGFDQASRSSATVFSMMSPETKHKIQLALLAALVLATLRAGYIFYQRHQERLRIEQAKKAQNVGYSNPDYYVHPKKLYPYDLKSAKQLTQQPVWVKEGYRYTYYPYDPASKKVDFAHESGLLGPIEKLSIKDVVTATSAAAGQQKKQVMAVFQKEGRSYAVPIGYQGEEQHQVKPGMNEMQADFAIGMGVPDRGDTPEQKTVHYPNGGKPVVIVYQDGKAAQIKPDSPAS